MLRPSSAVAAFLLSALLASSTSAQTLFGTWVSGDVQEAGTLEVITFLGDGRYSHVRPALVGGGYEFGDVKWESGEFFFENVTKNGLSSSLSTADSVSVFLGEGPESLKLYEDADNYRVFERLLTPEENPLLGSWVHEGESSTAVITFFDATNYLIFEEGVSDDFGQTGFELGTYSLSGPSNTGLYFFSAESILADGSDAPLDTNGEWGLSSDLDSEPFEATLGTNTFSFFDPEEGESGDMVYLTRAEAVPEPSTYLLLAVGLGLIAVGWHRKRQAAAAVRG